MPRRGRSAPARAPVPPRPAMRAPPPPRSQVPAQQAPSQPMSAANQGSAQQPSMFKQMAATAGGVAMGSAIGHVAGAAMMGGLGGGSDQYQEPIAQQPAYDQQPNVLGQQYDNQPSQPTGPCAWEISQFLRCAQGTSDITLCEGFNEALRECKRANTYN